MTEDCSHILSKRPVLQGYQRDRHEHTANCHSNVFTWITISKCNRRHLLLIARKLATVNWTQLTQTLKQVHPLPVTLILVGVTKGWSRAQLGEDGVHTDMSPDYHSVVIDTGDSKPIEPFYVYTCLLDKGVVCWSCMF